MAVVLVRASCRRELLVRRSLHAGCCSYESDLLAPLDLRDLAYVGARIIDSKSTSHAGAARTLARPTLARAVAASSMPLGFQPASLATKISSQATTCLIEVEDTLNNVHGAARGVFSKELPLTLSLTGGHS